MKALISTFVGVAIAGFVPVAAQAADFGRDYSEGYYEERIPPPPPPRVVERRYYESDFYEGPPPVVYYEPRYRWRQRHFAGFDPYWRAPRWRSWHRAYYGGPRAWDRRRRWDGPRRW